MKDDGSAPAASGPAATRKPIDEPEGMLLRRMVDGDEAALAALYDRLGPRVQRLALCILGDTDEAEDVVEETFWQAWRTASRYDGRRGTVSTWILVAARSRALDRLRARRRRADWMAAASSAGGLFEGASPEPPTAEAQLGESDRTDTLRSALAVLPPDQRRAIELAFLEGLSHTEIAERTGQPLGTVKTRIRLAMQKLRQRLASMRGEE